jgi:CMP-N-acetylneuraminic acid synthetase
LNILSIIPARIGSKGIPKKNLVKIGKYSLVERALFTAMNTNILDNILVSTDSKEIQTLVNKYGNYAPFLRPKELATDKAKSLGVIQHALYWAQKNLKKKYDLIVLLEPPSLFRLPIHIETAVEIAVKNRATSVVSLITVGDYHPIRMKKMDINGALTGLYMEEPDGLRRQDQEPAYIRNCAVYVFTPKTVNNNKLWGERPYGYEMDRKFYSINIDEPIDFLTAKAFYNKMKNEKKLNIIEILPLN